MFVDKETSELRFGAISVYHLQTSPCLAVPAPTAMPALMKLKKRYG